MVTYLSPVLRVFVTALLLCLILFFFSLSTFWKVIGAVFVLICSGYLFFREWRVKPSNRVYNYLSQLEPKIEVLPHRLRSKLQLVLVVGDSLELFFDESESIIFSNEQLWIRLPQEYSLSQLIESLQSRWPEFNCNLNICYLLQPEHKKAQSSLNTEIAAWEQTLCEANKIAGYSLPCYMAIAVTSGCTTVQNPPLGFLLQSKHNHLLVWDNQFLSLEQWCKNTDKQEEREQRTALTVIMTELKNWYHEQLLPQMLQTQASSILPQRIALLPVSVGGNNKNVWNDWLSKITAITFQYRNINKIYPIPNFLIPQFKPKKGISIRTATICRIILYFSLFICCALLASAWNNAQLTYKVSDNIVSYNSVPENNNSAKLEALVELKEDQVLLDSYFDKGAPARLGMGLYQGAKLSRVLVTAIRNYNPPVQTKDKTITKNVSLNAALLFDVGHYRLKKDSTKWLVESLLNIKMSKGHMIHIVGYTDSTGNPEQNKKLSLERAKAVRDWLVMAGGIPNECFVIKGTGALDPIANNATESGRAANRRVEIKLVSQSSIDCQY